jgi:hypothetical protein
MTDRRPQADSVQVTVGKILGSAAFAAGVRDVREGRPARFDAAFRDDWDYERGRQFAFIAPMTMPLRLGRRLNPAALEILSEALFRHEIL